MTIWAFKKLTQTQRQFLNRSTACWPAGKTAYNNSNHILQNIIVRLKFQIPLKALILKGIFNYENKRLPFLKLEK